MAKEEIQNSNSNKAKRLKKKKFNPLLTLLMVISLAAIVWSLYNIWIWFVDNQKNKKAIDELRSDISFEEIITIDEDTGEEIKSIDFSKLLEKNPDTVGWIKVNNTNMDYPVVQADNNDFYLDHSFDKTYNSAGWIFADYRNKFDGTDKNIILYGHHRKDGSMFADIRKALDSSWCSNTDNQIITFYTPNGTLHYQIFSSYKIPAETYYTTTYFASDTNYMNFLKTLESRSIYNYNVELNASLPIITFSTCGATSSHRLVIHAQLIEE